MTLVAFIAAAVLALVHLFGGRLRVLEGIPRSRWLSAAGGVSVAYVFLHLLPELSHGQETLRELEPSLGGFLEHHVYLVALAGLITFYGLERYAKVWSDRGKRTDEPGVFWVHVGSFTLYNVLVGYLLLHMEDATRTTLVLFTVAMALHFVVNDYGLEEHHRERYRREGRWLLSVAVVGGWALGALVELPEVAVVVLTAFLAGGIVLNVLKEELPEERQSRFTAFVAGAAGYALLLLAL